MDPGSRRSPDGESTRDTSSVKSRHRGLSLSHRIASPLAGLMQPSSRPLDSSVSYHAQERAPVTEAIDQATRAAYAVFEVWSINYGSKDPTLSQLRAFSTLTGLTVDQVGEFFDNQGSDRVSQNLTGVGGWTNPPLQPSAPLPSFSEFQGIVNQSMPSEIGVHQPARSLTNGVRPQRTALPDSRDVRPLGPSLHSVSRTATHEEAQLLDLSQPGTRSAPSIATGPPKRFLPASHIAPINDTGAPSLPKLQDGTRLVSIRHHSTHSLINVKAVFDTGTKRNIVTADFVAQHGFDASVLPDRENHHYSGFGIDIQPTRYVSLECGDTTGQMLKPQRLVTFSVADNAWPEHLKANVTQLILGSEWIKEQQTNVFSIVSGKEVGEPRAKRTKFSEEERQEVAKTRKVGACEECRRSKRKCTHVPHRENTKPIDADSVAHKSYAVVEKSSQFNPDDTKSIVDNVDSKTPVPNVASPPSIAGQRVHEQYLPCLECDKSFPQARWREHQIRKHFPQTVWFCPQSNCGFKSAIRRDNFSTHLRGEHHYPDAQVQATIKECGHETRNLFHEKCGFCGTHLNDLQDSLTHIIRHLTSTTTAEWQHRCDSNHDIPTSLEHPNLLRNTTDGDHATLARKQSSATWIAKVAYSAASEDTDRLDTGDSSSQPRMDDSPEQMDVSTPLATDSHASTSIKGEVEEE